MISSANTSLHQVHFVMVDSLQLIDLLSFTSNHVTPTGRGQILSHLSCHEYFIGYFSFSQIQQQRQTIFVLCMQTLREPYLETVELAALESL